MYYLTSDCTTSQLNVLPCKRMYYLTIEYITLQLNVLPHQSIYYLTSECITWQPNLCLTAEYHITEFNTFQLDVLPCNRIITSEYITSQMNVLAKTNNIVALN